MTDTWAFFIAALCIAGIFVLAALEAASAIQGVMP